jgi:hypothetical protein
MESTNLKPRRSVVEQITQRVPRHEPEVEESMEAFQEARSRSRESLMLDVRLLDGSIESFDYAHLARAKFLPEGAIVLCFGQNEVKAEGKNLMRLYTAITEHRARFIQEGTEAEQGLKPEDATHIERIVIAERDDS